MSYEVSSCLAGIACCSRRHHHHVMRLSLAKANLLRRRGSGHQPAVTVRPRLLGCLLEATRAKHPRWPSGSDDCSTFLIPSGRRARKNQWQFATNTTNGIHNLASSFVNTSYQSHAELSKSNAPTR